jgi:hypothetical protein
MSGVVAIGAIVAGQLAVERLGHEVLYRGVEPSAAGEQPAVLSDQRVGFAHPRIIHLKQQDSDWS